MTRPPASTVWASGSPRWRCWRVVALLLFVMVANAPAAEPTSDRPYPGTIALHVDVTDLDRRIFRVREIIPVAPGPMTLWYPRWLPGVHSAGGPIEALAGLTIRGNGRRLSWRRDPVQTHAFHLEIPADVTQLDIDFQFTSPTRREHGRVVVTPEIVGVQWEKVLLYPNGHASTRIAFAPTLRVPPGWGVGTSLEPERREADTVRFRTVQLETLVDSPVFAGKHFTRIDLAPGAKVPVNLDIVGDAAEELVMSSEQLQLHRKLINEAYATFGAPRYARYHFLLSISDDFGGIGLEHLSSSENGVRTGWLRDWDAAEAYRTLLPHELAHSWNGKFRRPADLTTTSLELPMQGSLLWVYEGMTQYWGVVLAARSGLCSRDAMIGALAALAAKLQEHRPGRQWRALADTTNEPVMKFGAVPWPSWQRTYDYYDEGLLLWLDIDTKLRELSRGARSLDDFARAFFQVEQPGAGPATYTLADVVATLNTIAKHDWEAWLREALESNDNGAPFAGLERAGWRLVFRAEPSSYTAKHNRYHGITDFGHSIGLMLDQDARISEVIWGSPAFDAGLSTAVSVVAVNGRAYSADVLERTIRAANADTAPIELLVREQDRYRTVSLRRTSGVRHPHLERIPGRPDLLTRILTSREQ